MLQLTKDLLNGSTAEFKASAPVDGSTTVTDTTVDVIATAVADINNALFQLRTLKAATIELEEIIGARILSIRDAAPTGWLSIVKAQCRLSTSRAYELLRIAEGTTSAEQTRRERNARQIKFRQKKAVRYVTEKKELADACAKIAELEKAREHQVVRFEHKIAELSGRSQPQRRAWSIAPGP
jgi:hypothetical protein